MRQLRVFVLLAQGGAMTSGGMFRLADSIRKLGNTIVTTHSWDETQAIANDIATLPLRVGTVLIGYSLGCGSATAIAGALHRRDIDLLVAYDPSRKQPIAPVLSNTKRAICYWNPGAWIVGGAKLTGVNVETIQIKAFHLGVCWSQSLHDYTLAAIKNAQSPRDVKG